MIARAAVAGLKSLAIAVEFGAGAAIEILDRTARRLEPARVLSPQPAGPPPEPSRPWTLADLEALKGVKWTPRYTVNGREVDRAEKTRQTLATAAAILRASGGDRMANELAAMQLDRSIGALNAEIRAYYTNKPAR